VTAAGHWATERAGPADERNGPADERNGPADEREGPGRRTRTAAPPAASYAEGMVELHPIGAGDGNAVHELLGDPAVATWLRPAGVHGAFTPEECELVAARGAAHWAAHGFGRMLAFDGDRCVGWSLLGHTIVAGRAEVEIGWSVTSDRWGQGLATALGADALGRAQALGLDGVVAFTRRDNGRSRRVMEKLELQREREFEHAGLPHVLYRHATTAVEDSS